MHGHRHAHASCLRAGGADLKTVMDRLGHTQIATTQRYLHALDNADNTSLEASGTPATGTCTPSQHPSRNRDRFEYELIGRGQIASIRIGVLRREPTSR